MFVFLMEMCFFLKLTTLTVSMMALYLVAGALSMSFSAVFFLTGYAKEPPDRPCDHFLGRHLHTVTLKTSWQVGGAVPWYARCETTKHELYHLLFRWCSVIDIKSHLIRILRATNLG